MNNIKSIVGSFLLVLLIGCAQEEDQLKQKSTFEEVEQFQQEYSGPGDEFPTSCSLHEQAGERQFTMGGFNTILPCEAEDIDVFFEPCFNETGYADAIPASLDAFNALNSPLNFNLVSSAAAADLVFSCRQGGCCGCANASFPVPDHPQDAPPNTQTFFPSGGSIGAEIALNINWAFCPDNCTPQELNLCFFMRTVMHEIMHILGLYHNDQVGVNPIHIPGTPTGADPGSVINSGGFEFGQGNWCNPSCEFSEADLTALDFLYPCEKYDFDFEFNAPVCLGDVVTFNLFETNESACQPDKDLINVTASSGLNIMAIYDFGFLIEAHDPGPAQVCATVEFGNFGSCPEETVTHCVNFNVSTSGDCNGGGDPGGPGNPK